MNSSTMQINWMRKRQKKEDQRYGKLTLFRLTQVNKSQSICFSSDTQSYIDRHWNVYMCRLKKRIRPKENLEK